MRQRPAADRSLLLYPVNNKRILLQLFLENRNPVYAKERMKPSCEAKLQDLQERVATSIAMSNYDFVKGKSKSLRKILGKQRQHIAL